MPKRTGTQGVLESSEMMVLSAVRKVGCEPKEREALHARRGFKAPVVDWPAGTPGRIQVGRTAGAGDIWTARAASTLNKLTKHAVEYIL